MWERCRKRQAVAWDPIQPMWKNGNRQHTIQSPDQQGRLLGYTLLSLCSPSWSSSSASASSSSSSSSYYYAGMHGAAFFCFGPGGEGDNIYRAGLREEQWSKFTGRGIFRPGRDIFRAEQKDRNTIRQR